MNAGNSRLLVVDDNEMNRDLLARRLTKQGHSVVMANDGQQALDLLEDGQFDLMLLDIEMPGLSGLDVLAEARRQHTQVELPIIMVTSRIESQDPRLTLRASKSQTR